ncbi:hypothetical protein H5410_022759 [Solanum commersonii]|uniref:Uncharacterized protein n=1 Tax=Solanum commersonii TaxID=4109 RepID=A0A9J5ZJP0_SOLCO|nr:hypothetical protein H5410_022759 [Solanum commersonii]
MAKRREMGSVALAVGHPEGYINFCGQGLWSADLTQWGEAMTPAPTITPTSSGSSRATSMGPSSSRSTQQLGAAVVPLARVQKLEA